MARIQIRGLVRTMNGVRRQLAAGVTLEEQQDFRNQVSDTITLVENICRRHRIKPRDLPAPSYRAYCYLKEIDLENLPLRESGATPPPGVIRIAYLVKSCDDLQMQMTSLVKKMKLETGKLSPEDHDAAILLSRIRELRAQTENICQQKGGTPADLPDRSRRAYQWLHYLSDGPQLMLHLDTLVLAYKSAKQANCIAKIPRSRRKLPVSISIFNISAIYRARNYKDSTAIVFHEGFICAPPEIIEALVCSALAGKSADELATVKSYASGEDFTEISLALSISDQNIKISARGQKYDLEAVFRKVNKVYFGAELNMPKLAWSKIPTRRKFGHYQPNSDTLIVSQTLDNAAVPVYVVEFIMYHELLHKKLGTRVINGRHYAHTPEFKETERRFAAYDAAQDFLKKLAGG